MQSHFFLMYWLPRDGNTLMLGLGPSFVPNGDALTHENKGKKTPLESCKHHCMQLLACQTMGIR